HGNLRGPSNAGHASNAGWGAWEVNPAWVLNHDRSEWAALLRGDGALGGRYGRDRWPHSSLIDNLSDPIPPAQSYAPVGGAGTTGVAGGAPSAPLRLPGTAPSLPFQCFPSVPAGYGNGSAAERLNHPRLFNPFQPYQPDRTFALSGLEALLRYSDTGSPG